MKFYKGTNATIVIHEGKEYQGSFKAIILASSSELVLVDRDDPSVRLTEHWAGLTDKNNTAIPNNYAAVSAYCDLHVNFKKAGTAESVSQPDDVLVDITDFTPFSIGTTSASDIFTTGHASTSVVKEGTGLRIINTATASTTAAINGASDSNLSIVSFFNNIFPDWLAFMNYRIEVEGTVGTVGNPLTTARSYVGLGIRGMGQKTPANGATFFRFATDSAQSRIFSSFYETSGTALATAFANGDPFTFGVDNRENSILGVVKKNGTTLLPMAYENGIANDIDGRIGPLSIFTKSCSVLITRLRLIKLDRKTAANVFIGNSIFEGWGLNTNNNVFSVPNFCRIKMIGGADNLARSSATYNDYLKLINSVTRLEPESSNILEGTNGLLINQSLATMQTDINALITQHLAIPTMKEVILWTCPPVLAKDVVPLNNWIRTNNWDGAFGAGKVKIFDLNAIVRSGSNENTWNPNYTSDFLHWNTLCSTIVFEAYKAQFPTKF